MPQGVGRQADGIRLFRYCSAGQDQHAAASQRGYLIPQRLSLSLSEDYPGWSSRTVFTLKVTNSYHRCASTLDSNSICLWKSSFNKVKTNGVEPLRLMVNPPNNQACPLVPYMKWKPIQSAKGISTVSLSWSPTTRVVWPLPVRSSASKIEPGPQRTTVPSLEAISASPANMMEYWRRGAQCQSRKYPGAFLRKVTPAAFSMGVPSPQAPSVSRKASNGRSDSSMWDRPSSPV